MFLKYIILEGFKSYKEKTTLGPLDKGQNAILGLNGAGKSNFFCAVELIFSEKEYFMELRIFFSLKGNSIMFLRTWYIIVGVSLGAQAQIRPKFNF